MTEPQITTKELAEKLQEVGARVLTELQEELEVDGADESEGKRVKPKKDKGKKKDPGGFVTMKDVRKHLKRRDAEAPMWEQTCQWARNNPIVDKVIMVRDVTLTGVAVAAIVKGAITVYRWFKPVTLAG